MNLAQIETNPLDSSKMIVKSWVDGNQVLSTFSYTSSGDTQMITRTLEDDGKVYHVEVAYFRKQAEQGKAGQQGRLIVHSYFSRIGGVAHGPADIDR